MLETDDVMARERASSLREAKMRSSQHTVTSVDPDAQSKKAFGQKTITLWGSICLNFNSVVGPAIVLLPLLNQQAGWLTPLLAMVIVCVVSAMAATMLCEAMQRIPGNFTFAHRYEFSTVVRHYFGQRWYIPFQIVYNLCLQATNIAAMMISAKVVDEFMFRISGRNWALDYVNWRFVSYSGFMDYPWCVGEVNRHGCDGDNLTWVISLGYIICCAICIPFGYLNLDENMWFQWVSFAGCVLLTGEFCVQFLLDLGHDDKVCLETVHYNSTCDYHEDNREGNFTRNGMWRTPAFRSDPVGQANVVGLAIFACSYVVTIPSWVNEKRHRVSVNAAVWWPAVGGLLLKLFMGLTGAWAFWLLLPGDRVRNHSEDILQILVQHNQPKITQYAAYLWDLTTLIPGIPVLAIMIRYNLLSGKVCGPFWSFMFGVVAPWIVTAFLYNTSWLNEFCNWVAILLQGLVNCVVPVILYRSALLRYPDHLAEQYAHVDEEGNITFPIPPNTLPCGGTDMNIVLSEDQPTELSYGAINDDADPNDEKLPLLASGRKRHESTKVDELEELPVNAVPRMLTLFGKVIWINRIWVADFLIVFFAILSLATIVLNIVVLS